MSILGLVSEVVEIIDLLLSTINVGLRNEPPPLFPDTVSLMLIDNGV